MIFGVTLWIVFGFTALEFLLEFAFDGGLLFKIEGCTVIYLFGWLIFVSVWVLGLVFAVFVYTVDAGVLGLILCDTLWC